MFVEFKEIRFKNILSYGSKETIIDFKDGLNAIVGKNGQGKSTLLDALSFCLYGQPYRKIKLSELVNRTNKKNLWVKTTFNIGKNSFIIERSLAPAKLIIKKNGEDLDLLSSKKLNQTEIDAIIGVDYKLFKQIICLAINYNKPFLSLPASEKREIIESIFNIKIFGLMASTLKKEQSSLKVENKIHDKSLSLLEANLKSLRKQVNSLEATEVNFDKEKEIDLRKNQDLIDDIATQITDNQEKIKIITESLDSLNYEKLDETKELLNEGKSRIKVIDSKIESLENKILQLKDADDCPLCGNNIDEDHRKTHLTSINKEIEDLIAEKLDIDSSNILLEQQITEFEEIKGKHKKASNILFKSQEKETSLNDRLELIKTERTSIEERTLDIDIESVRTELKDRMDEYQSTFKLNTQINDDIETNKEILGILSEKGIKSFFFKKLTPLLNNKVNEYLDLFDIPIILEFDEYMDEEITTINRKTNVPYMAFSEGEKKRIDISILLSFIEITKSISNWNANLLFFDELLDGATDSEGLEKIINSVKLLCKANNKLCVYIISHKIQGIDPELFQQKLIMKKKGQFSEIEIANT